MPDDPIISGTPGALGDVFADLTGKEFYCLVDCPPVGKLRLTIRSGAFSFDVERSEKADGTSLLCLKHTLVKNKASESLAKLHQLSPHWQVLWSRLYEAFLQVRRDYERAAEITSQNCSLTLTPPDLEAEYWGCELQLDPWDGFYAVKFNASGDIVDACAMF